MYYIICLTRQPEGECAPVPAKLKLKNSRQLLRAGRLFFMCQIQNRDDQQTNGQDYHKFLICTHNNHPFPQDSERVRARPPAVQVSILYCHGAAPERYWDPCCDVATDSVPAELQSLCRIQKKPPFGPRDTTFPKQTAQIRRSAAGEASYQRPRAAYS